MPHKNGHSAPRSFPLLPVTLVTLLALEGSAAATATIAAFEKTDAPVVAQACTTFHAAENNPLVQAALPIGEAATGAVLGAVTAGAGAPAP